jgi:hypothetical protein
MTDDKINKWVFPMYCKCCKSQIGWAEHEAVNLGICHECGIWLNRMNFMQRRQEKRDDKPLPSPVGTLLEDSKLFK